MRGAERCGNLRRLLAAALGAVLAASAAHAQEKSKPAASIWEQETLTGDWGGARSRLKERGLDFTLNYIGETFKVFSGGLERRASYEGRAEFSLDTDLEKLLGWTGATAHVTVYGIHNGGHNTAERVGSISDPSNIDAVATTRLFTLWLEQSFNERVSVRVGQLAADDEFFTSETASGLINGTFGWADLFAANITSGGPAYPLATPGVRLKVKASEEITLLAAAFTADPAGRDCFDLPQRCNPHGTTFSFAGGTLWMSELQYAVNQDKRAVGLPGKYKMGAWYSTAQFADQHFGLGADGLPLTLADPSGPAPLLHRGDWGVYGIADQTVWRGEASSVNLFVRGGGSPSDRNLISYYVDGGIGIKGLLPGRADDTLTLGAAYAKISGEAIAFDRDNLAINGPPYVVRDREILFEASYAAQIAPWWTVQPDIQYVWHPNGGQNPDDPTLPLGHAFYAGVRSTIRF
jgi:porin